MAAAPWIAVVVVDGVAVVGRRAVALMSGWSVAGSVAAGLAAAFWAALSARRLRRRCQTWRIRSRPALQLQFHSADQLPAVTGAAALAGARRAPGTAGQVPAVPGQVARLPGPLLA